MTLVTYSDSEGESDTEKKAPEKSPAPHHPPSKSKPIFQPLIDRGNPGKIFVNLSETKPGGDDSYSVPGEEEGSARKRPRTGGSGTGGSGLFAGFNDMLPAPKKPANKARPGPRISKPFTLKTSAEPGFSRSGTVDDMRSSYDEFGKSSEGAEAGQIPLVQASQKPEMEPVFEKKGNPMMFKPLSVARNKPKKRVTGSSRDIPQKAVIENPKAAASSETKSKVNLFGLSGQVEFTPDTDQSVQNAPYESLLYTRSTTEPDEEVGDHTGVNSASGERVNEQKTSTEPQDLASVANDLNLSRSEMRQLLGRDLKGASSKVLKFNTDEEYKSNSTYLANTSEAELAAQQHRPVRAVAPGKHSLSQLVNAVTSQREALEDSFAAGKRNRKEASSRYGW